MRKILSILFTVMLVLSFNLLMAVPAIAALNGNASISPAEADYDLSHPDDVETTITWNDANSIISIVDDDDTLVEGTHYTVGYFDGTAILAIWDDYLAAKLLAVGDNIELTINFDIHDPATFTITAIFEEIPEYDLTIASTAGGSVTEPGEGTFTYDEGAVVDLRVAVEESSRFVNWTGDVSTVADVYAAVTNITMNDSYSITANFEEILPLVNWALIVGIIAAVVIVGLVIFFVRRKRAA